MTNQGDSTTSDSVIASPETAGPPSAKAGGVSISGATQNYLRAAFYVDGFNLYHAIDDLAQPHLKWVNLADLGNRIVDRKTERLIKARYFTAIKPPKNADDVAKNARHAEYITALKYYNVAVHQGHFIFDDVDCHGCGRIWQKPQEKETDVNIAVHVLDDAYQDVFDVAYLLTADSDQAAMVKLFARRFSGKKIVSVVPPLMEASRAIMTHTEHRLKLPVSYIEDCLLPAMMTTTGDQPALIFRRPPEYAPPSGWLPPKQRPKKEEPKNSKKTSQR